MKQSHADPVIDEIREVRHRISARVDHEPARLVAYYIELQKRYEDRFVAAAVEGSTAERGVSDRRLFEVPDDFDAPLPDDGLAGFES